MSAVYIAGPMRGIPDFNFPAFHSAEANLKKKGFTVYSPARHDEETGFSAKGLTGNEDLSKLGFNLREALAWDLDIICRVADLVRVLPDWQKSKGTRAEIAAALAVGIPVTEYVGGKEIKFLEQKQAEPMPPGHTDLAVSSSGGKKGKKMAQYALIPVRPLKYIAERYGRGAEVYGKRNSENGYEWSLSYDAMLRHANDWWGGEDDDPGMPGNPHLSAVAWHALNLMMLTEKHPQFDDRPK